MIVSIVIPAFNEEKNIERLLISIRKQALKKFAQKDIEIIVVDDESRDNTAEIAKRYSKQVYRRKHAERSVQRNFGAAKAHGKYMLFLDGDMELTESVIQSSLDNIDSYGGLIIPERTVGTGFIASVRKFERKMYMGDPSIEVARFFPKKVFWEYGGYDKNLTGTEDYDLPKRISAKYEIGWAKEYLLHHETGLTLAKQLKKKFYYAKKSAAYVDKHPDLISKQGILILRKAYLVHWREFVKHPILGAALIVMRTLETIAAAIGFLTAVGPVGFIRTFWKMISNL